MKLPMVTVESERHFEKQHLLKLKEQYLQTDIIEKVANDEGYRDKLSLIAEYLGNEAGWILDIGSHTCGEAEYLSTKGYNIICTEINEYALDVSQSRCEKYGRPYLSYVACDGHQLPFKDGSIHFVMYNESLHHMMNVDQSLSEVYRVLAPGGKVFFYEPYAYNPYRRISEVRDYFKGTIEKSFGVRQMEKLLSKAGFLVTKTQRHVGQPSQTKLKRLPLHRRLLRQWYYQVGGYLPQIFGMIAMLAEKPGILAAEKVRPPLDTLLQCPISHAPLQRTENGLESQGLDNQVGSPRYHYSELNGIPVLIPAEAHQCRS